MVTFKRSRIWLVLSICASAAVLTVTLAVAGEKQATISATSFHVDASEHVEKHAACPGRKRALGGGLVQSDLEKPPGVFIGASGPLDASGTPSGTKDGDVAKQWFVALTNNPMFDINMKVFAICAKVPGATIEANSSTALAGGLGESSVKCTGSRRALGGGVVTMGSSEDMQLLASGPLDRTAIVSRTKTGDVAKYWYAGVENLSEENFKQFKVFAICAKDSRATIETNTIFIEEHSGNDAREQCDGSKRAVGGGVAPVGALGDFTVGASGPLDHTGTTPETKDGDVADRWYARGFNDSDGTEAVKVFVICV